jgi:hypothetical protein
MAAICGSVHRPSDVLFVLAIPKIAFYLLVQLLIRD